MDADIGMYILFTSIASKGMTIYTEAINDAIQSQNQTSS
jgi:hypothetical protein